MPDSRLLGDPSTLSDCNPSRDCLFWLSALRSTLGDSGGIIYDDALGVMDALGVPSELNSDMPALIGLVSSLLVVLMLLTPVINPPDRLPLAPTLMAFTLRAPGVLQGNQSWSYCFMVPAMQQSCYGAYAATSRCSQHIKPNLRWHHSVPKA